MEVNIETYRYRIGSFNTARPSKCKIKSTKRKSYKSNNRIIYNLRKLFICMFLTISMVSRMMEEVKQFEAQDYQDSHIQINYVGSIASASTPINLLILGGQVSLTTFPVLHLSFHDILAVHSAATVQGVQAGPLDRGWVVAASPRQFSILSDSNFYARYTYGNRTNRGLKLSHWNAGSAFLENKRDDIETLISDHHPHLLGISEANLYKDHRLENCKIDGYELITSKTMDNVNLRISRVVVYKHTSVVAKVREDLMSDQFSSVWLEVGFPGKTKILVCNLYTL